MTLNEVCEFIVDCPHSTAKDEGDGYPLIRTPNIGRGRLILDGVQRVSKAVFDKRNARAVPQLGDLIFAREAPAGNVAVIQDGQEVCLGQRTVLIRPNHRIADSDFLAYYLLSPEQQYGLTGTANGATVAHVNLPVIRNLKISLPDLDVQRRIAGVLKAYDDLIENNQKQIKLLEEAAQRLYKEWFVDLHFPGYEDTKIVDGLPEGWEKCTLEEAIEFNPKTTLSKKRLKQSIPVAALSTNSMVLDTHEFTETESNSGSKFQNGDTLLARITPCLENGKIGYVTGIDSEEGAVGSTEFIVMRGKDINQYMVYLFARTHSFRQYAINTMTGSDGRQRAQVDKLKTYPYILPPKEIINIFGEIAKEYFDAIEIRHRQAEIAGEARDRLLPKLMSGELEV